MTDVVTGDAGLCELKACGCDHCAACTGLLGICGPDDAIMRRTCRDNRSGCGCDVAVAPRAPELESELSWQRPLRCRMSKRVVHSPPIRYGYNLQCGY